MKWTFLQRDVTLAILNFFFGNLVEKCKNHLVNKTYNKISKKHFFEFFDDLNQENGGPLGFLPIKKNAQSPQGASFDFLHHCSPNWYKMKKNSVYTLCQGQNTWPPDQNTLTLI